VVFIAPYLTKDQEKYDQAVIQSTGRSRRFGQQKDVHVYRFVTLNSIDVDVIETNENKVLEDGKPLQPDLVSPFEGFVPSGFALTEAVNGSEGRFRSEWATWEEVEQ
jgi:hypothetical protein